MVGSSQRKSSKTPSRRITRHRNLTSLNLPDRDRTTEPETRFPVLSPFPTAAEFRRRPRPPPGARRGAPSPHRSCPWRPSGAGSPCPFLLQPLAPVSSAPRNPQESLRVNAAASRLLAQRTQLGWMPTPISSLGRAHTDGLGQTHGHFQQILQGCPGVGRRRHHPHGSRGQPPSDDQCPQAEHPPECHPLPGRRRDPRNRPPGSEPQGRLRLRPHHGARHLPRDGGRGPHRDGPRHAD